MSIVGQHKSLSSHHNHNHNFIRKLSEGAEYRVDRYGLNTKSICGQNDLQHINDYQGDLGQSVAYAQLHQSPVGALASKSGSSMRKYCTGTLVASDLFLTANHCIDSSSTDDYVVMNYERAAGSSRMLEEDAFRIEEIVEQGGSLDYAVVRVSGHPGYKYGWTTLRMNAPVAQELITIIQHPLGQAKQIDAGHVARTSGNYMYYGDVDTEPGSSGSGILDANGHVYGVHTNGGCYSSGGTNSGVRLNAARNSPILSRLAAMTLSFADGDQIKVTTDGNRQALAVDPESGEVMLAGVDAASRAQTWTVRAVSGGAHMLLMTVGDESVCLEAGVDGHLLLNAVADSGTTACHWRALKTEAGGYMLRAFTAAAEGRWLNAGPSQPRVGGLSESWGISVL